MDSCVIFAPGCNRTYLAHNLHPNRMVPSTFLAAIQLPLAGSSGLLTCLRSHLARQVFQSVRATEDINQRQTPTSIGKPKSQEEEARASAAAVATRNASAHTSSVADCLCSAQQRIRLWPNKQHLLVPKRGPSVSQNATEVLMTLSAVANTRHASKQCKHAEHLCSVRGGVTDTS